MRFASGAVRVAAIDKKQFEIFDFLASQEIVASPGRVRAIFPAALADTILLKAKS
jgi:hypothetical protein